VNTLEKKGASWKTMKMRIQRNQEKRRSGDQTQSKISQQSSFSQKNKQRKVQDKVRKGFSASKKFEKNRWFEKEQTERTSQRNMDTIHRDEHMREVDTCLNNSRMKWCSPRSFGDESFVQFPLSILQ
jgi:hypothetical protein